MGEGGWWGGWSVVNRVKESLASYEIEDYVLDRKDDST